MDPVHPRPEAAPQSPEQPARYLLLAGLHLSHVVLLQPAAGVGRVPVGRPVQRGAHVGTGPPPQQLLPPRVQPHEAAQVVDAAAAADQAGALRAPRPHLGGAEGARRRRRHRPPLPVPLPVPLPAPLPAPPRSAHTCSSAYMHMPTGHAPLTTAPRPPRRPLGRGAAGAGLGGRLRPRARCPRFGGGGADWGTRGRVTGRADWADGRGQLGTPGENEGPRAHSGRGGGWGLWATPGGLRGGTEAPRGGGGKRSVGVPVGERGVQGHPGAGGRLGRYGGTPGWELGGIVQPQGDMGGGGGHPRRHHSSQGAPTPSSSVAKAEETPVPAQNSPGSAGIPPAAAPPRLYVCPPLLVTALFQYLIKFHTCN